MAWVAYWGWPPWKLHNHYPSRSPHFSWSPSASRPCSMWHWLLVLCNFFFSYRWHVLKASWNTGQVRSVEPSWRKGLTNDWPSFQSILPIQKLVKDGDSTTLPYLKTITQQGEFADSVNTIRFKIFLFDKQVRLKEIDILKKSNIRSQGKPYQILTE